MDKGITFTHLGTACMILSIVGGVALAYILSRVKNMISDSEKTINEKIDKKIEKVNKEQDDKHTIILLKLDEMVKGINRINVDIAKIEVGPNKKKSAGSE